MTKIANYINGKFVEPISGSYLDNVDPSTGQVYSQVPDSDERDVEKAVEAATNAFKSWSTTPAAERSNILLTIADLIEKNLDKLAMAECVDNGKPLSLACSVDIPRAATNFRYFATAILHTSSEAHFTDDLAMNYTLRQPRGVVGCISPWNLPLYLFTWKVAPAIATGNTVVAKPSELTPMTAYMLGELCSEASLPPGVLNIIHGLGNKVGAPLVAHPSVTTISFTGGTVTGSSIAATAAPMFKKLSLECGGKNPNIIFADADMDLALDTSVRAAFANQGEICLCGSRIFVERSEYDSFVKAFVEKTQQLKVGDPLESDTNQGALVSEAHLAKVYSYVDLAQQEGGTILTGGKKPQDLPQRCKDGFFLEPTVITGLDCNCRTNQEEIFGPISAIMPFDSESEVIEFANSTKYGLSGTIFTQNLDRAHRVAAKLQSGTIWINSWMLRDLRIPFGGMKHSGMGREGGAETMRFFTEPKNVCVKLNNDPHNV